MIAILAIAALIGFPLMLIWSINTLFGLGIDYGFAEWLAAAFLLLVAGSSGSATK